MTKTRCYPRYAVRRNPATGRWVTYYRFGWRYWWPNDRQRTAAVVPVYRIMGDADTMPHAIEGIFA